MFSRSSATVVEPCHNWLPGISVVVLLQSFGWAWCNNLLYMYKNKYDDCGTKVEVLLTKHTHMYIGAPFMLFK